MRVLLASMAAALALLAGCAASSFGLPSPGESRESVLARMGSPTRIVPLPSGQRLQYSRQPIGQEAWMVDLDAAGRVVRVEQALNELAFRRVVPDVWTAVDVEREFGPPARIDGVANWDGPIMNYRWRDLGGADMFFWVYLDRAGVVRRTGSGMEFRNNMFEKD